MSDMTPSAMTNAEFVNKFLRKASEPRIEQIHLETAKLTTDNTYNMKWQVAVRKVFYEGKPFNRLKG